jgi:hypothetical protein
MVYLYDACDQISDFCHQQLLRKMRRKISWSDGRTEGWKDGRTEGRTDGQTDRGKTVYTPPGSGSIIRFGLIRPGIDLKFFSKRRKAKQYTTVNRQHNVFIIVVIIYGIWPWHWRFRNYICNRHTTFKCKILELLHNANSTILCFMGNQCL